jgi:hypothetical protein
MHLFKMQTIRLENTSTVNMKNLYFSILVNIMNGFIIQTNLFINLLITGLLNDFFNCISCKFDAL